MYDRLIGDNSRAARVRIAVLDTGLDTSHPDYEAQEERIQGVKSFIPDCRQRDGIFDRCGHGTHVAGLLLDFAPDAELYIAKISDSEPAKPTTVAEVYLPLNQKKFSIANVLLGYSPRGRCMER